MSWIRTRKTIRVHLHLLRRARAEALGAVADEAAADEALRLAGHVPGEPRGVVEDLLVSPRTAI